MIEHVLAVVAVRDIDSARQWYEQLFDRRPDNNPMPSLVEWRLASAAWLQVTVDPERAGSSLFNVAVGDIEVFVDAARSRGIDFGTIVDANKGVRLSSVSDPDGNSITAIGGFRELY
ncbi:VOC family protein [Rhodococcus sp. 06-418-5]|uniref:VOC family protein n=1 Tax=Nocardiaceae TaxID=85025 RepID=UPI00050C2EBC|nr:MULTISPECIES: VOC family protein [Rhodococcus]OZC73855.1 VOC family protein [Rhodococcus sp. 06-418-5]OZD82229.1 VOC family protein [Rhodococcus sp. 05-339-2]OZE05212.1 VOC family protein [Rhodococcus sp. 05-2255-3C]OZE11852.1 VOC family protein [Rhodococcus sp. 05-2255-3B1]OZE24259.1 VOC family protein [Rhodococcus sp. 05-2255-2A2]